MYLYDYCTASDLKPQKIQPKTLNSTPHPFKISLFSFWGCASEMGYRQTSVSLYMSNPYDDSNKREANIY